MTDTNLACSPLADLCCPKCATLQAHKGSIGDDFSSSFGDLGRAKAYAYDGSSTSFSGSLRQPGQREVDRTLN